MWIDLSLSSEESRSLARIYEINKHQHISACKEDLKIVEGKVMVVVVVAIVVRWLVVGL